MAGYKGYSMSNNAVAAYEYGEKPLSKWTKKELLNAIFEIREDLDFSNLTVKELKDNFLCKSGWHHTSKLYNVTDFYSINEDIVREFTQCKLEDIIKNRPKKVKRDKEIIEREKEEKKLKEKIKEDRKELEKLFKYQTKYKTLKGFLKSDINVNELRHKRANEISKKRNELKIVWEKQLVPSHWIWGNIDNDDFIESYIK